jgi:4-hydroxybenzoate polyprenyltransferase
MSQPSIATSVALAASDGEPPIVVDLDETLIRTDLLIESFFILLASHPVAAIAALNVLRKGKAAFKSKLADAVVVEVETLPFNEEVLAFLKAEKSKGRPLYLVSASDRRYVERVAGHLGLFDGVFGSDAAVNLAGPLKADRLCNMFGERGFDYICNGPVDEAVWRRARGVYIANASPTQLAAVRTWAPEARGLGTRAHQWRDYVRALRVHQWLKNLLVFAPALAAHQPSALLSSLLAFISFSLCASSVYIFNDLLDLRYDRAHPRKRLRPFAAGRIRIVHGGALFLLLLLASLLVALFLPIEFVLVLAAYFILTCAYSLDLKRRMLIDVVTLAALYGSRVVGGGVATGIPLSPWLMAFAIFLFFSLAIIKRCAELGDHLDRGKGDPVGRGYRLDDLPVLRSMAIASGYVSVLVLALYINGDLVGTLYRHPDRLWLNCILLLFWVSRMIMVTHRGRMGDDPLVFAATDRSSQLVFLSCAIVTISAII